MKLVRRLFSKFASGDSSADGDTANRGQFHEVGFHGDKYLIELVDHLMTSCDCFIETGTNVGSTLAYVGREYPGVQCLSYPPAATSLRAE